MPAVKYSFLRNILNVSFFSSVLLAMCPASASAAAGTTTSFAITTTSGTVTSVASGTAVTLTATVKAGASLVTAGSVNFCDASAAHCNDIHLIGIAQLTPSGTATLKFVPGPGVHSYKAEFAGTLADAASTSTAANLTVNNALTTTAITQSGNAGNYTLKATVTGQGSATGPTGKVSFLDTSNAYALLGTANLGSSTEAFSWTTPQSPATSAQPQSIVAADFNGDGILDLAIGTNGISASKNIGSINMLLGNGNGTFQAAKAYTGLAGNQLIVVARFVTGGPEDILAVNNSTVTTNNGMLFIGDGKGGLGTGTMLSLGIDTITAVITGDFNSDGKEDFVVAGQAFGVPAFNVFLGNGNGTFNSGTLNATSNVPITSLGAGDFTGKDALDVAVVHSDGTVDIFLQDGQGNFYPNAGTSAGTSPTAIAVGDFNGDGKTDLAITNSGQDNVSILLGNGAGNFTASASPNTGPLPKAIAIGDFNADGIADFAIANSGAESVTILLGKGDGTFTSEPALNAGNTPASLAIGMFDGKNTADIAVVNEDLSSNGTTSTATILLSQRVETATATATGIAPTAAGTHLVDASYPGDTIYHSSVSATTSLNGTAAQSVAPVFSPAAGTYTSTQTIALTSSTTGATIYYTTNGTTPTTASTKYTAPFPVASTETIEAITTAPGYSQSIVASARYTIETPAATPTFSPAAGTYTSAQTVTIASSTPGTAIYYTTNGATPTTSSTYYSGPIGVSASETVKAIAVASGFTTSAVGIAAYTINSAGGLAAPAFSVAGGTYPSTRVVTITDSTAGAAIYYTTDGSTPTTSSTIYSSAVIITSTHTLKAVAYTASLGSSAVTSATYTIVPIAATPTFSVAAGTYTNAQTVTIADATSGAKIYYTNNGATPTTVSTLYTGAITVSTTETIKAIAVASGFSNSVVASAAYTINSSAPPVAPVFSQAGGTYPSTRVVTITDATSGATIYYTTDGTTPTTTSTVYSSAVIISSTHTLKAIAYAASLGSSAVASATYTIVPVTATPTFSETSGTYASTQTITLADSTHGAKIYYTTDGSAPTTSSTVYSGAITVSTTETIQAMAAASGFSNSAAASATYTISK